MGPRAPSYIIEYHDIILYIPITNLNITILMYYKVVRGVMTKNIPY